MKFADTTYVITMMAYCPECGYGQHVKVPCKSKVHIAYCNYCSEDYLYKVPAHQELDNIVNEFEIGEGDENS